MRKLGENNHKRPKGNHKTHYINNLELSKCWKLAYIKF